MSSYYSLAARALQEQVTAQTISADSLASALGVSRAEVSSLLAGITPLTTDYIVSAADLLGVAPISLIEGRPGCTEIAARTKQIDFTVGDRTIAWSEDSDLDNMLYAALEQGRFPRMPWTGVEGGFVLIALEADGNCDRVITFLPAGRDDPSDRVEQMLSVRNIGNDLAWGLDQVMTDRAREAESD